MKLKTWTVLAASAVVIAACDSKPTEFDTLQAQFDQVDPVVAIFTSTYGLPDGPFAGAGAMPFMGNFTLPAGMGIQRPGNFGPAAGAGAQLPDSLKLTDAQKTQIRSLMSAFETANAADIAATKAAHMAARAAHRDGRSREEIKALLDAAKPAAERIRVASQALRSAVQNVLTPAQKAWMESHRPTVPFRMP